MPSQPIEIRRRPTVRTERQRHRAESAHRSALRTRSSFRVRVEGALESSAYERPFASLNRRSTSPGMRPRAGTAIPLSVAQARITLGSRFTFALGLGGTRRRLGRARAAARLPIGGDGAARVPVLVERFGQRGHVLLRELEFAPVPVPSELDGLCTLGSVEVVDQHVDRCFRHCLPFHETTSDAIGTVCGRVLRHHSTAFLTGATWWHVPRMSPCGSPSNTT